MKLKEKADAEVVKQMAKAEAEKVKAEAGVVKQQAKAEAEEAKKLAKEKRLEDQLEKFMTRFA